MVFISIGVSLPQSQVFLKYMHKKMIKVSNSVQPNLAATVFDPEG